jgi:K+-sensing histidine kinase KdpD
MQDANVSKLSKEQLDALFKLALQLLALEPQVTELSDLVAPFQGVLGITAVCVLDASTGRICTIGTVGLELKDQTHATYIAGSDQDDVTAGVIIRRLVTGGRIVGAIALKDLRDSAVTAEPLILLAADLLDRARLLRLSTEAAVGKEIDAFRAANLDVLIGECRNSLATILAAAGGLRELGPLLVEQLDMAVLVEEEASRLGNVISRLDWTARLDRGEISPRLDTISLTALVAQSVDHRTKMSPDRRIVFSSREASSTTLADPELIRLVLSELIEYACGIAAPDATVYVEIEASAGTVTVSVFSEGDAVPFDRQQHIFERPHLGTSAPNLIAGSGLGLYAARKIALAHGGTLELDADRMWSHRIAFRLSLPSSGGLWDESENVGL